MKLRVDRFIALCRARSSGKEPFDPFGQQIPILMYHSISDQFEGVHPYYKTKTSPSVFESHMRYLKRNEYRVLSLAQAATFLNGHKQIVDKSVVITFDDGFRDFLTDAAPVLSQFGYTATVFLPTAYITDRGSDFKGTECLKWDDVGQLMRHGFSFGSHTITHPVLTAMSKAEVEREINTSKWIIESRTGKEVTSFSYPYAYPDRKCISDFLCRTLKKAGYKIGVTTRIGRASHGDMPFMLKRIPVNDSDDLKLFEAKLKGAYDWLYLPQRIHKLAKSILTIS